MIVDENGVPLTRDEVANLRAFGEAPKTYVLTDYPSREAQWLAAFPRR